MKRLKILTAVCLTALFLCFFSTSVNASNDISIHGEVGFDGTYLRGSWTPVRVVLKNTGNDLEGSLEVTVKVGQDGKMAYSTPVSLPNTSEKEYTIYAQIPEAERNININLTDGSGKTLKSVKVESLNPIGENNYLLGLVTNDQPSLGYWKEKLAGNQLLSNYEPISLDASNFPDRREVLSAFSLLIFNNIDTGTFRPEQLTALNAWLEDGGVLIIGTGLNGKKTLDGLTANIVPNVVGELKEVGSPALLEDLTQRQVLSEAPLQIMDINTQEGKVLLGDGEHNLVWMFQKGEGIAYLSAFDLGTEPILSWTGNKLLWENLLSQSLNPGIASRLRNPFEKNQYQIGLGEVLGYIEAMEMPSIMLILFLFLFYLALVGPFNYMVLKKIDRREWSWITIPALSIIFAVLIFGLGYNTKGGELIINTISVVDLDANQERGNLTNHIGIFIPRRGDYEVEVDRFALLSPGIKYNSHLANYSAASEARMVQGNPSRILFDNLNIWTMETFETDTIPVEMGHIQSDLYYELGKVKGTVTNNTLYPLENLVIYTPSAFVEVGSIAAGEMKNVELTLPAAGRTRHHDNIYQMIDTVFPWPSGITVGNEQSRKDTTRRSILNNLIWPVYEVAFPMSVKLPSNIDSEGTPSLELSYFAFYQGQPEEGITINGRKPDQTISDGIILGSMDLTLEKEGVVSIPPGMFFGELEGDMSAYIENSGDYFYIQNPSGYAVFSIDLSPYIHLEDLKVMIGVDLYYGNGIVQVYDIEAGDYVDVHRDTISIDEDNFNQYIDPDNKVYIKVLPGRDSYVEMGVPTITLEGREP